MKEASGSQAQLFLDESYRIGQVSEDCQQKVLDNKV